MALATSISATSIVSFHRLPQRKTRLPTSPLRLPSLPPTTYRLENGLQLLNFKHSVSTVLAASGNRPPPKAGKGKTGSSSSSSSSVPDGPPLLTILAGVVVFLLVCLVIGSVISWIVGLIVNVPRS